MNERRIHVLAGAWGLAEATLFFIVPDVGLTFVALESLRSAWTAVAWTIVGALAGAAAMYAFGAHDPVAARRVLDAVPAIGPAMIAHVRAQLDQRGLWALGFGPLQGVPYKIYAVEWGARHGDLPAFLLVSIPARGARFVLTPLVTAAIRRAIEPLTGARRQVERAVLALFWVVFYAIYFWSFRG